MYFAHTKTDPESGEKLGRDAWQPLLSHLRNTAAQAAKFGTCFQNGELAYACGLFHDIGKYADVFQSYLVRGGERVDHSTAGAQEIFRRYGDMGKLLAYCVAGHHAGLPDGGTTAATADDASLRGRLRKKTEPFDAFQSELAPLLKTQELRAYIHPLENAGFSLAFLIRMIFSCLVDADYLDSEEAMNGHVDRGGGEELSVLAERMKRYITRYAHPERDIDRKRTQILRDCIAGAERDKGLYTLTVPTGGGKTVASLAFSLLHAARNGMRRVIYVIPYNSIIEQNAAVFKEILGDGNVLEHHSNIDFDGDGEQGIRQRHSTENWDMPVIVTTMVQFFESLFAARPSKCRKLHSIADSVLIFDEAQMLPVPYLLPCVRAIAELVRNYGCTAVLCSATQPALRPFFPKELEIREICGKTGELYTFFKRTRLVGTGQLSDAELAARLCAEKQVLCIVGTRAQAAALFALLKGEGIFHLSTLMYPVHRRRVLDEIRERLKSGLACRVVSTSLIEAGVDVDFPVVFRAQAGLDSQIQSAGRCNREGRYGVRDVFIFEPEEKYQKHLPSMLRRPLETARSVARRFDDCASPEAIETYFRELYAMEGGELDEKRIVKRFEDGYRNGLDFPFATVAEEFRLIENATRSVFIPDTEKAREIARQLDAPHGRGLLRQAQQYIVSVYEYQYKALCRAGAVRPVGEDLAVLVKPEQYHKDTGLDACAETGAALFV